MKNILYAILLSGASLGFFSCSETDYPLFDDSVINIYFTNKDFYDMPLSIHYHDLLNMKKPSCFL